MTTKVQSRRVHPLDVLAAFGTAWFVYSLAGPIFDTDSWWHVLVGSEIRAGTPVQQAGQGWSIAPIHDTWATSQWLSEVGMSLLHSAFGWAGTPWIRLISGMALAAVLSWTLLRRYDARVSVPVYLLTLIIAATFVEDRPQSVSFVLAAVLGAWLCGIVFDGRPPRWWVVLTATVVWANLHPMWVLAPMTLAMAGLARVLDHGIADRAFKSSLLLSGMAALAGLLTPLGPQGVARVLAIRGAASDLIGEWHPTFLTGKAPMAAVAVLLLIVVAWARGADRPTRGEVLVVLLLGGLGATAFRMITPAILIVAATVTRRLALAWPTHRLKPQAWDTPGRQRALAATCAAVLVVGGGTAIAVQATTDPTPKYGAPSAIVAELARRPAGLRVVNQYALGGYLLATVGNGIRVGIDGRTDYYGAAYISEYNNMIQGSPGWQTLFNELAPDSVVLSDDAPLKGILLDHGWTVSLADSDFVLLDPPTEGPPTS